MDNLVKVAVDAMGGDYAPAEPVKGAVDALAASENIYVFLVGKKDLLEQELSKYTYPKERLAVVHAPEVIETAEPPGECHPYQERFFYRNRPFHGAKRRSGCICLFRKYRRRAGRRTGFGRQSKRSGAFAVGAGYPHG